MIARLSVSLFFVPSAGGPKASCPGRKGRAEKGNIRLLVGCRHEAVAECRFALWPRRSGGGLRVGRYAEGKPCRLCRRIFPDSSRRGAGRKMRSLVADTGNRMGKLGFRDADTSNACDCRFRCRIGKVGPIFIGSKTGGSSGNRYLCKEDMPKLYIIAGCNGAGKTTASYTVLPEMLGCKEFVNADEIAKGLSPFNPGSVAIEAGRLMLRRMNDLLAESEDFAFETTLATRSYVKFIERAHARGYFVTLLFFWLPTPRQAVERVATRVREGGHTIPSEVIRRRYANGIANLTELYTPICDFWTIYDNSSADAEVKIVASGVRNITIHVEDTLSYQTITDYERD